MTEKAGDYDGARRIAWLIKQRIRDELKLTCSVGLAYSKTAAKTASEEKKPDGYFEIPTEEAFVNLILNRDVQVLYTVGKKTAEKLNRSGIRTVRDIQTRQDEVIRLLGRQGQWIVQQALGKDDRKVVAYRPEEAKSISRELTFQEDVEDFDFLKDVLVLLSLSVEKRAERVGLYGEGVHLKITYSDMKTITRSRLTASTRSAAAIMREAAGLLEQVQKRPVRLIGVGIYHMTGEMYRQVHFDDLLRESSMENQDPLQEDLERLHRRYGLDFAGNLDKIFHGETLYKTVEYMRKHK